MDCGGCRFDIGYLKWKAAKPDKIMIQDANKPDEQVSYADSQSQFPKYQIKNPKNDKTQKIVSDLKKVMFKQKKENPTVG